MKKNIVSFVLAFACAFSLAGCGSSAGSTTSSSETSEEKSYTIGISQFAEHGSLDDCRNGFLEGLKSEGIEEGKNLTVDTQNANADTGTAATIAQSFVSNKVDLICAIATPSAMSAYNAAKDADIPVIFTAVSDPVAAELANDDGTPVGEITGTSDALPIEEQLKMIRAFLPDAKTIGILHTSSETNSDSQLKEYQDLASKYNFEIVDKAISQLSDVPIAANDLAGQVDCITNLTDNTVVQALSAELDAANKAGIPVFGSEIDQVKAGCIGCEGLDYEDLGKQTGIMAAKVLKGEAKASEQNFQTIKEPSIYLNTAVAKNLNIAVPAEYLNADGAQVFDSISESTQE
jgi:putative ABC transport system substrate-binding protein